jgi:hypothetical protein
VYKPRLESLEDRFMLTGSVPAGLLGANLFDSGPAQPASSLPIVQSSPASSQPPASPNTATPQASTMLTGIGITISAQEGQLFNGTVANFTDTNTADVASQFTATITWEDGMTTGGTIGGGNGSFSVSGTHTFADEGSSLPVSVTMTETGGAASATANSTANATDTDVLMGSSMGITATEGQAFSGTVATFTDSNTANVSGDFTATITWGDGTSSTGTVAGSGGSFTVSGTHTYNDEGSNVLSVTLTDDGTGTATGSAGATATVTEADTLTGTGVPINASQGVSFTGSVATFTDTNTANTSGDFTATINWGDGTSDTGTVSGGNGSFTVSGTHTYSSIMSFAVSVVLTDDNTLNSASASSTAVVSEVLTVTPVTITPTEGAAFAGTVATFSDSDTALMMSDFTATINWGDGTSSTGTVTGSNGSFAVADTHTYADEGPNTIVILVQHAAVSNSANSPITVAEGDLLSGTGTTLSTTETGTISGTLATFTDTLTSNVSGDFTATITWGDGTSATGTVNGSNGSFSVSGSHTYGDEGTFTISVTLTDDTPGTATATANTTVTIPEADSLTATGTTFNATEGQSFTRTVATFTDTNSLNVAGDFTATITWGDGASDIGTVSGSNGSFSVSGTHTYGDEGSIVVSITISDDGSGTAKTAAGSTANVAENDSLTGIGMSFNATQGVSFTGSVATFTDTNTANTSGDFTATINWGDGTSDVGTVSGSNGAFSVSGTHTYSAIQSFSVSVVLTDDTPGTAKATANSTAVVSEVLAVTPVAFTTTEGTAFSGTVATFTDAVSGLMQSDFTATIAWGDGASSAGTIAGSNGSFTVTGSHTYNDEGPETAVITVARIPPGTASGSANNATTVSEGDALSATSSTFNATQNVSFTGTVATFTDTLLTNVPADFTATINWGDGTSDTGTVSGSNGSFTVTGTHTYSAVQSFSVTVTLTDDTPGTATATANSTANVSEALTVTPVTFAPTEGTAFSGTVATFTDTSPSLTPTDFTATIAWGDGTSSAGTVTGSNGSFTVTGSHSYNDEGPETAVITVARVSPGTATGSANNAVTVAEGDALTGNPRTVTLAQNVAFTGTVATFTDTLLTNVSNDFTATINWGDGTSDTGTVSGSNGSFTVSGTHTYSTQATFTIAVTLTDDTPGTAAATANSTAIVGTSSLIGTGTTITATEGTAFSGTVGTFSDSNTADVASQFSATITWGDGTSDPGTVSGGNGSFTVTGTHTYNDEASVTVGVTLTQTSGGSAMATASSPTTVGEGDSLSGTGTPFTATEGTAFSGTVATFTDTLTTNVAGDFAATITWGDGTSSTGTVSGSSGSFTVTGSHIYSDEGTFTASVTLTDDTPGTATTSASSTATVSEGDSLSGTGTPITGTEGTAISGTVATFTDTLTTNVASDFTATIDWGDGSTSAGTVAGSNGSFTVTGSHTYNDEGTFTTSVTLTDDTPGTATVTATSTATIAEADSLTANSLSFNASLNQPFTATVATFTDTLTSNVAGDFTATINWGDGTTGAGSVTGSNGSFSVSGSHTYSTQGTFTVGVTLTDDTPGTATATASSTANVSAVSEVLTVTPVAFAPTEAKAFTGTVATFTDTVSSLMPSDFTATIAWGDGATSSGTITATNGGFAVTGTHTYADEASESVLVTVTRTPPGTAMGTSTGTTTVAEGDVLTGQSLTFTVAQNVGFSATLATFTDTNTANVSGDFTATISWGDGTTSAGTVTGSNGSFSVSASHTYTTAQTFTLGVTLTDDSPGTATATANSTAIVGTSSLIGTGTTITATEGTAFTGTVGTFSDSNTADVASQFTATITWGDGSSSTGTVAGSNGAFTVTGSHTYSDEGTFVAAVSLTQKSGGSAKASANSTAAAAEGDTLTASGTTNITATEGAAFSGTVAVFSDTLLTNVASDFTATINWGDGTTSTGTVTGSNGSFTVMGTHTYNDEGNLTATVTLTDDTPGTATATATSTASVAEGDTLANNPISFSATEGIAFTGAVATFSNSNAANVGSDFTAVITWGDGSTSVGTVAGGGGTLTVFGTHTYADEGSDLVQVTVTDDGTGTATSTAMGAVTVAEGDKLTGNPVAVTLAQNIAFTGTVATFTDTNLANTSADFLATINWGDGTNGPGTVTGSNGTFTVTGTHTYTTQGTFTIAVTLTDDGSGTATATVNSTAVVGTSSLIGTGTPFTATEGIAFSGTVATFSDSNLADVASQFSATIAWGDGSTSAGTVTGGNGSFTVTGSHTSNDEGSFSVGTTLTQTSGGSAKATAQGTGTVSEGDSLIGTGATIAGTEGQPFTGTVGTFTDSNTSNVASDFTAVITWGDGSTSTGTVTGSNGSFTVSGTHSFTDEGSFTTLVRLIDDAPGTATATAQGTANVAESDTLTATPVTIKPTEGTSFSGSVATFTTANTANVGSDFTATIDWGDGATTAGTVTGGNGTLVVSGTHTYAEETTVGNNDVITVTISEDGTSTLSAMGTSSAAVQDAPLTITSLKPPSAAINVPFSGIVATFTDANPSGAVSDFSAVINWGDGSASNGSITLSNGVFSVTGSHTYIGNASVPFAVTVNDVGGASASSSTQLPIIVSGLIPSFLGDL